jgi:hypothetical protein
LFHRLIFIPGADLIAHILLKSLSETPPPGTARLPFLVDTICRRGTVTSNDSLYQLICERITMTKVVEPVKALTVKHSQFDQLLPHFH